MDEKILADICNKLIVPKTALEKLANGEEVPQKFLEPALKELNAVINLLKVKR